MENRKRERETLNEQIEDFFKQGGKVEKVPYGCTGEKKDKMLKRIYFNKHDQDRL